MSTNEYEIQEAHLNCSTLLSDPDTVKYGEVLKSSKIFGCFTQHSRRIIVLKGQYLLRYKITSSIAESKLIGAPISIHVANFYRSSTNPISFEIECEGIEDNLSVEKRYVYICNSIEDCDEWLHQLRLAKDRIIKENLHHVAIKEGDVITNAAAAFILSRKNLEKDSVQSLVDRIKTIGPIASLGGGVPPSAVISFSSQLA